ncbi:hypothetical protein Tco_1317017 [Tanacetum coccineum]
MSNPKFAKTYNLVAFLEKPKESDGFEGIIDFLNASSIRYALTFWSTAKVKTVNGERQIHALVDKKNSRRKQSKDSGPTKPIPDEATNEEHISSPSYDPPQSGEDRLQLTELMSYLPFHKKKVSLIGENQRLLKQRIASIKEESQACLGKRKNQELQCSRGEEVVAEKEVVEKEVSVVDPVTTVGEVVTTANVEVTIASAPTTTIDELTLAQTLIEIKAAKPKAVTTDATTTTTTTRPKARGDKDKGKAIIVELEIFLKKKDQIALDEEVARNLEAQLQAELEEERLARQKEEEAIIALIES